jgi:tetratricopeptide (TPR) repeat protein
MNDYQLAIALDPSTNAYNNRGHLKAHRLNDPSGALADFNQAIANNPKYAGAFNNRGWLKANKLNDKTGAIADLRQAQLLYGNQSQNPELQETIQQLRTMGAG